MEKLAKIKEAIAEFEKAQTQYRDFGAGDTEPDGVFHVVLKRAVQGEPFESALRRRIDDGNPWDLYSTMPGYQTANNGLTEAARPAYDAIVAAFGSPEWRAVKEYLRDYAWRVDWGWDG